MANGNGPHSNPVWSTFIFVICMVLFLVYLETMFNPMDVLSSKSFVVHEYHRKHRPLQDLPANQSRFMTFEDVTHGSFDLNDTGNTLVTLHIQKTSGKSFSAHIALDLDNTTGPVCNCSAPHTQEKMDPGSCKCRVGNRAQSVWFFNRLTVGWPCGVHPGWTDITLHCLDQTINAVEHREVGRRYGMVTILRDPLVRYVNEWHHVTTTEQWPYDNVRCHPLHNTNHFQGNWAGQHMDAFIHCPDNPANNRQVHMLADLRHMKCSDVNDALTRTISVSRTLDSRQLHNTTQFLLESAKENLNNIAFFGLSEYLEESEKLFEYTFGVRFRKPLWGVDSDLSVKLTPEQKNAIIHVNKLDTLLYEYAKVLFFERLNTLKMLSSNLPYMVPKVSHRKSIYSS